MPMVVGGTNMEIILDTGASAALSLSKTVVARLLRCRSEHANVHQGGVNGEKVCSDALRTDVTVGPHRCEDVQVFANSSDVEGADGYAGMALLRMFELWLHPSEVGVRLSGLPHRPLKTQPGVCSSSSRYSCA